MDWYDTVFDLIDARSFSNLWFWVALAVLWSSASHWVLGVPFDLISRARRHGGDAQADLEAVVGVNVRRMLYILRLAGLWIVALSACVLTALAIIGFGYRVEVAQAVFLLAFPTIALGILNMRTALRIEATAPTGEPLCRMLTRHRMAVQGIGMVAILITALWGSWHNMNVPVL